MPILNNDYGISAIPRFILLNDKGKLLDIKAPVRTVQNICTHSTIDIKVTVEIERPELPAGQFRSLLVV